MLSLVKTNLIESIVVVLERRFVVDTWLLPCYFTLRFESQRVLAALVIDVQRSSCGLIVHVGMATTVFVIPIVAGVVALYREAIKLI